MKRKFVAWLLATIIVLTIFATTAVPASAAGPTKTALTIFAPATVHSTKTFDITGKLLTGGNVGLGDMPVSVYKSTDGKKWTFVGTGLTDSGGYYAVSDLIPDPGQLIYKATFAGNTLYKASKSGTFTVTADNIYATKITITVTPPQAPTNSYIQWQVFLTDGIGRPIQGKSVHHVFTELSSGTIFDDYSTTNENGLTTTITASRPTPDTGIVTADFAGDANYLPSSNSAVGQWTQTVP